MDAVYLVQGLDGKGDFVTYVRFDQSSADEIAAILANASVKRFNGDFRAPTSEEFKA